MLVTTIDALEHFEQGNYSTVRGDGGSRVGEVRGLYATVTVRDPPNHTSSLRVKILYFVLCDDVCEYIQRERQRKSERARALYAMFVRSTILKCNYMNIW